MQGYIESVEEYLEKVRTIVKTAHQHIFRGQEDADWPVVSSAYRRLEKVFDKDYMPYYILHYHKDILNSLKKKRFSIYDKPSINEFDIIADMQHLGAATMLIDFTRNSLVALYFACLSLQRDPTQGAVYIFECSERENVFRFDPVNNNYYFNTDSKHSLISQSHSARTYFWEPNYINQRIPAQDSVFVFGTKKIEIDEDHKILVERNSKKGILEELKSLYNIYQDTLFNDPAGFAFSNGVEAPLTLNKEMMRIIKRAEIKKSMENIP